MNKKIIKTEGAFYSIFFTYQAATIFQDALACMSEYHITNNREEVLAPYQIKINIGENIAQLIWRVSDNAMDEYLSDFINQQED